MSALLKPISHNLSLSIARILLAGFLFMTAISRFTAGDASYFAKQVAAVNLPTMPWLSPLLGVMQLLVVLALLRPKQTWSQFTLYAYAVLATVPLWMMFTHPVWIDALGGFPAIGAGQGLIKYLAISGVSLYLASHYAQHHQINAVAAKLLTAGVVVVMLWIGAMKFTQIEADGIEGLMSTSPLFSWLYSIFSVLHASYFIGVIELVAVLAIFLAYWSRTAFAIGLFVAGATFVATQTFIISLPAYETHLGFPVLTGSGQFIVKDLVLLAASIILYARLTARPAQAE